MKSRLCRACKGVRWPMGYARCPRCGGNTTMSHAGATLSETDAQRVLDERFAGYYAEREAQRMADGWVAPEYLGKQEAHALFEQWKQLEELVT